MKDLTPNDIPLISHLSSRILLKFVGNPAVMDPSRMDLYNLPRISITLACDWLERMRTLEAQAEANVETKQ